MNSESKRQKKIGDEDNYTDDQPDFRKVSIKTIHKDSREVFIINNRKI